MCSTKNNCSYSSFVLWFDTRSNTGCLKNICAVCKAERLSSSCSEDSHLLGLNACLLWFSLQSAQSAVCRPKKLSASYSESRHLLGLKVWLQRVLTENSLQLSFQAWQMFVSECWSAWLFWFADCTKFFETPCSSIKYNGWYHDKAQIISPWGQFP